MCNHLYPSVLYLFSVANDGLHSLKDGNDHCMHGPVTPRRTKVIVVSLAACRFIRQDRELAHVPLAADDLKDYLTPIQFTPMNSFDDGFACRSADSERNYCIRCVLSPLKQQAVLALCIYGRSTRLTMIAGTEDYGGFALSVLLWIAPRL